MYFFVITIINGIINKHNNDDFMIVIIVWHVIKFDKCINAITLPRTAVTTQHSYAL